MLREGLPVRNAHSARVSLADTIRKFGLEAAVRYPWPDIFARYSAVVPNGDAVNRPISFGDPLAEYHACSEAAGLMSRPDLGVISVSGADRVSWLQGMVTQDVGPLGEGRPCLPACILDSTGHLRAEAWLVLRGDSIALLLDQTLVEPILLLLDSFIIMERVELVDQSDFLGVLELLGPAAARLASGVDPDSGCTTVDDCLELRGSAVVAPLASLVPVFGELVDDGAIPAGFEAWEMLRVERGGPRWGAELDSSVMPAEAGLDTTHISFTKGCYVGQEIVARLRSRGHTNRSLVGLVTSGSEQMCAGMQVATLDGKSVGRITSVAHSPRLGRELAMGYLRHDASRDKGDLVGVSDERRMELHVLSLPAADEGHE